MNAGTTFLAAVAVLTGAAAPAAAASLDAYRWTSRLLVVLAPGSEDPDLIRQHLLFDEARAGADARDLVRVEAVGDDGAAREVRRRFGIEDWTFRAILVGKDGGAKLVSPRPIEPARLFEEIDAMPMRRDEMRRTKPR